MKITCVFVSNYLNHHQIPFCNAMNYALQGSFVFVQTEPMEEERVKMGWNEKTECSYLKLYYEECEYCKRIIQEADLVLFGGCDDEKYIEKRLAIGRPVIRISERLYKTGQWKAVSPRGLMKKYHDHTSHRREQVYLLCAGGYVASDFHIVRAYPGKMYRWGYFPKTEYYSIEKLIENKRIPDDLEGTIRNSQKQEPKKVPYILWAARMIHWKHPELPLEVAKFLKSKGYLFLMDLIGGGDLYQKILTMRDEYGLQDCVRLLGFQSPDMVRSYMEKADIFLFTSDRQEGWGAVLNESMNSGCAVVADHLIGAVPYLIQDGVNGLVYRDGDRENLFTAVERLVCDNDLCRKLGVKAYETITGEWNAESAAINLLRLSVDLGLLEESQILFPDISERSKKGPCTPAPIVSERRMYKMLTRKKAGDR